jgi:hypothetical protein
MNLLKKESPVLNEEHETKKALFIHFYRLLFKTEIYAFKNTVLIEVKNSIAACPCSRECELDCFIPPNGA